MQELISLFEQTLEKIEKSENKQHLYALKTSVLGKKGSLTEVLKKLGQLSTEERPKAGQQVNEIKTQLEAAFAEKESLLDTAALALKLNAEKCDVSLAGRNNQVGTLHPISLSLQRITQFFTHNGFILEEGPQIEDEDHNFNHLNIPAHHPARASHDTFYFGDGHLLRTHTSNVQIRYMEKLQQDAILPPYKILGAGRVYRCDYDQTHSPMFHQVEGLWIDRVDARVNFLLLQELIRKFLQYFFECSDLKLRFRPSYFPFTEPSAEVDIWFNGRWLEVLGCGMVHPEVLKNVGLNKAQAEAEFQGFAFGLGVERLTMVRYGITDLRMLFENDIRFLRQF